MSTDQLFMLEVVVEQIVFPKLPVPQKKQVIVGVTFGELINMEIRTDTMGTIEAVERSSKRKDMDINCGKSVVFMKNPTGLIEAMKGSPLEVFVATKLETAPMGRAIIPWDEAFLEMVESAIDSVGYVTPVELRDRLDLSNDDEPAGTIRIYERLTYLGKKIETSLEIIIKPGSGEPGSGGKVHLFKGGSTATTFQVEKYGIGSDTEIVPVAPLYTTIDRLNQPKPAGAEQGRQSIQSLISSRIGMGSQMSMCPSVFGGFNIENMINQNFDLSSSASDTVSIRMKVPDKMFQNLQDLKEMTAETLSSFFLGFLQELEDEGELDVGLEPEPLSTKDIERMLCGHPDCPAAKLFQKYGIGPLKNGNGLGGLNKMVDPPITYGLSHCNGRIDDYGPLGTYKRPRCPKECFIPKNKPSTSDNCSDCPACPKKKKHCDCAAKLKGGSIPDIAEPLRLRGGGTLEGGDINDSLLPAPHDFEEPCLWEPSKLIDCIESDQKVSKRSSDCGSLRLKGGDPTFEIGDPVMSELHSFEEPCRYEPRGGIDNAVQPSRKISDPSAYCSPSRLKGGDEDIKINDSKIPETNNFVKLCDYIPLGLRGGFSLDSSEIPDQIFSPDPHKLQKSANCEPLRLKGGGPPSSFDTSGIPNQHTRQESSYCEPLRLRGGGSPCRLDSSGITDPHKLQMSSHCEPLRLRGGGPPCSFDSSGIPNPHKLQTNSYCQPLRLRGDGPPCSFDCAGIPDPHKLQKTYYCEPLRLRGGGPPCSFDSSVIPDPRNACQDLMEEFNKLLEEYKNALGPCGHATCPFSPNVLSTKCQKTCKLADGDASQRSTIDVDECSGEHGDDEENIAACAAPDCPYKRAIITPADKQHKKNQNKPACGNVGCPFVKDKLGLDVDEIVYMPPQPCAGKECPFQVPGQLPPIHWDCPEPLPPEGQCKNPECPYVKKNDLLKKYFPQPISPCGSPECPYAVMPCNYPGCPFNNTEPSTYDPCPPVCPYTDPVPSKLNCTPSTCPFAPLPADQQCENPNCPYTKQKPEPESVEPPEEPKKKPDAEDDDDSETGNCKPKTCAAFGGGKPCGTCEEILKKLKLSDIAPHLNEKNITKHYDIVQPTPDDRKERKEAAPATAEQEEKGGRQGKGDANNAEKEGKKKKRRRKKGKRRLPYVYDEGTYYPGNKIGHRECIVPKFRVPPDMGWMWNVHTQCLQLRPRRGWKPGAIGRTIAARIDEHRKHLGLRTISTPNVKKSKKRRMMDGDASDCDSVQAKPTLLVKKKDGVVYVTMNPLKDPKTLEDNEDPYMDCTPMQFKIVKNKTQDRKDDFKLCYCGEGDERPDDVVSTSSSELDIEFTPPAGIIHPERMKKKKNVCHTDTQYYIEDCCKMPRKSEDKGDGKKGKGGKKKGKKK